MRLNSLLNLLYASIIFCNFAYGTNDDFAHRGILVSRAPVIRPPREASISYGLAGHIGRACTLNTIGATEIAKQYVWVYIHAVRVRAHRRKRVKQEGKKLERETMSNAKRV